MNKTEKLSLIKKTLVSVSLISGLALSSVASAAFIDFDTDQGGAPYVGPFDSFISTEYNGVIINDSDPTLNSTFVNLINPANVGTSISGYYANIGAFAGVQTQVTLDFTTAVSSVDFDFANAQGFLTVSAFNANNDLLDMSNYLGADAFINQAGFGISAGHVSLSGFGDISKLIIEPNFNEALILDNLGFRPVPLPAAFPLFTAGLIGLAFIRRRKTA